jgi:tetratricopeptide (TPR) repeat protein
MALDRDKITQAAQKYVDKKKYDKAVLEYQKLVQADPSDARTLLKIGDLQTKLNAHADAIVTYESVGRLYAQQGFALKAIAVYKQIREIIARFAPQLEERYGHITPRLADLYKQLGLVSDALAALDEVATKLQNQGRDREAVGVFQKIVELDPTNPLPHLRLAEAHSRIGDVDGAVAEFTVAAGQLTQLGRRDDAIKVLERSLHHRADVTQARACAELYVERGTREDGLKALAKLQVCFQANPKDLTTLSLLARAFNLIGQAQKGIEVQKEMARIARDAGETDKAQEIVQRLMLLAPNDEGVRRLAEQVGLIRAAEPEPPARAPAPQNPALATGQQRALGPQGTGQHATVGTDEVEEYDEVEAADLEDADASQQVRAQTAAARPAAQAQLPAPPPAPPSTAARQAAPIAPPSRPQARQAQQAPLAPPPRPRQTASESRTVEDFLSEAEGFRRVKFYDRALSALSKALDLAPQRIDVLEAQRDILIEAGRAEDAIETMLRIAGTLVEQLDAESAAQALQDVLAYDPHNRRALEMLHELGYEVVSDSEEQPLPSFDGPDTDTGIAPHVPAPAAPAPAAPAMAAARGRAAGIAEISDPFEPDAQPLPSFPLRESHVAQEELPYAEPYVSEPPVHIEGVDTGAQHALSAPPRVASQSPQANGDGRDQRSLRARAMELDDALEEIEFFLNRGLLEDARIILEEQLGVHPNHPLLLEHLNELVAQEEQSATAQVAGSGARTRPSDHVYDLENSLEEFDSWVPAPQSQPQQQVDIEEIFSQFKEGVAKQISVDDSQSHYDLGLAYKEMGYLDDAIREFEIAARDARKFAVCQAMIGSVEIARGRNDEGLSAFLAGLGAELLDPQQETMLAYEVGFLYEERQEYGEALRHYMRAQELTPGYRDVDQRVTAMRRQAGSMRAAAVNAGEDWDAAFDDIIQKR